MTAISNAAMAAGARVGRYFNVISFVPSLLLLTYLLGLLRAGAWGGPFVPADAFNGLASIDFGAIALTAVAALTLGVIVHPFQFAMIQTLEGYWGTTDIADRLMEQRVRRHRSAVHELHKKRQAHTDALKRLAAEAHTPAMRTFLNSHPDRRTAADIVVQNTVAGDAMVGHIVRQESAARALGAYPMPRRVRPTRLGNALRHYEDTAGTQYGLRPIPIAPHLALTAAPQDLAYQADTRQELDLAVRVCFLSGFATAATGVLLADDGLWVLLTLAPYTLAYLAYRGAVSAAHGYGTAVATVLDLNRWSLYERLRLPLPNTQDDERAQNAALLRVLAGENQSIRYEHFLRTNGEQSAETTVVDLPGGVVERGDHPISSAP